MPLFSINAKPKIALLSTFFAQCQQSGVRLIFSHGALNYRHQQSELSALLAPLKLRKREKKALINEALKPLFTYTLSPNDVHQAIKNETQPPLPSQICDACAPGVFQHYGYLVADQGWCSQCHGRGECLDVALIEYYRQCGIDDETINDNLPRKRWNSLDGGHPYAYQSLGEIKKQYQHVFQSASI
ncbi:hypothetical protein AB4394_00300 [Vibrio lentus]